MPAEFSSPKLRLEDWPVMTWPGDGKPVSRQWPLVSTSAGSVSTEAGKRITEPEQLLSETVPAKLTACRVGDAALARCAPAVSAGAPEGAATAGAAPAPAMARAKNAATRGFLMWGPLLRRGRPEVVGPPTDLSCALLAPRGSTTRSAFRPGEVPGYRLGEVPRYRLFHPLPRPVPRPGVQDGDGAGVVGADVDGGGVADVGVMAGTSCGAEVVGVGPAGVSLGREGAASLDRVVVAVADGGPDGVVPSDADRVPAVGPLSLPPPDEEPVREMPATRAATDTAPTAPAVTTPRRERHPVARRPARRRSARPPVSGSRARRGSSRVSS